MTRCCKQKARSKLELLTNKIICSKKTFFSFRQIFCLFSDFANPREKKRKIAEDFRRKRDGDRMWHMNTHTNTHFCQGGEIQTKRYIY